MSLVDYPQRILSNLENGLTMLANISIFIMMFLISLNAISRYLFNSSIKGSHTIVTLFLLPVLVFFSLSKIQRRDAHIKVNILSRNFDERREMIVNISQRTIMLFIFVFVTYTTGIRFWESFLNPSTAVGIISFPTYITQAIVPIGFLLLSIRLLYQVVDDSLTLARTYRGNEE